MHDNIRHVCLPLIHSSLPRMSLHLHFNWRRAQQLISVRVLSSNKDIGKLIGENGRDIAAIREQCEAMLHISGARDGSQSWHQAMHAIFAILVLVDLCKSASHSHIFAASNRLV